MKKEPTSNKELALSELSVGAEAYVSSVIGSRSFRSKILGLGLKIGAKLKIKRTSSSKNGCLIVAIGDSRLVIARGMAEKIIVSSLSLPL